MFKKLQYLIALLLLSMVITVVLQYTKILRINEILSAHNVLVSTTYKSVVKQYSNLTHLFFENQINNKEVCNIVKNSYTQPEKSRKELYDKLSIPYRTYKVLQLKQLHFHLKNNHSFLRFHKPLKFGDDLTSVRATVKYANEKKKFISGFEEGRIYNGYRFVFPLFLDNEHIGSVETSVSMKAISKSLTTLLDSQIDFLMSKEVVQSKLFASETSNYQTCVYDTNYVLESNSMTGTSKGKEVVQSLKNRNALFEEVKKKKIPLSQTNELNGKSYIVTVFPIMQAISNDVVALFVITKEDSDISNIKTQSLIANLLIIILLVIIFFYMYRLGLHKEKLASSRLILEHKANFDQLTKIPNRSLFDDRLEQTLSHSQRKNQKFALLFIDVDKFKEINDTYGHNVGDKFLIEITKRIFKHVRESDTFARIGGDEFAIIMDNIDGPNSVLRLVQGILSEFNKPAIIGVSILDIATSIGVSVYPDDSQDIEEMLKYADLAMYHVKNSGGNSFAFYDENMNQKTLEKLAIKKDLIKAIEREEFIVYYQPQIDVSTNTLLGMEALVRWQHPEKGLVFPDYFIPVAESTGLIVALDRCVMKIAMEQFSSWYEQGYNPGRLSLNFAMKQIESDECIMKIQETIEVNKCVPEWLELEITESDLMTDPEKTISTLNAVRDLGIKLSIDDFGTGYSSLTYLKEFPISKLKIDQSFVRDLDDKQGDKVIINSIIALAKALNLEVIAEGVETDKQRDILLESDCNQMQGYLFSKPIPAEKMEVILRDGLDS